MGLYITDGCVDKWLNAFAETPVPQGDLWRACWGGGQGNERIPLNVERIAKDILGANQSRVVLVHGRYGTGKSSFMKSICAQIEQVGDPGRGTKALTLWLDMPGLTSYIDSTALAMVMIQIVERLQEEIADSASLSSNFSQALEDLWSIEAREMSAQCGDPCQCVIPPEPSRMAGAVRGEGRRYSKANTLEKPIDKCLIETRHSMVVFLDDLDRCKRGVAMDVVRLLLRFGTNRRVHFVLACDWDVLEQGVKDWMHKHGKAEDGSPVVTANSALEKYIHTSVELPGMGKSVTNWKGGGVLPPALRELLETRDGVVSDDVYKDVKLFDVLVNTLLSEECQ